MTPQLSPSFAGAGFLVGVGMQQDCVIVWVEVVVVEAECVEVKERVVVVE